MEQEYSQRTLFFFAGVVFIYAVSGIMLNHKRDFNSDFSISVSEFMLKGDFPFEGEPSKAVVEDILSQVPEKETFTRFATMGDRGLKIFFKGGSSLEVDLTDGAAKYEKVRKRPVISSFNRLHYNPSRWWTVFSDIFAGALILITLTGLFMLKGPRSLFGRGGVEFIVGMLIPLAFMLL